MLTLKLRKQGFVLWWRYAKIVLLNQKSTENLNSYQHKIFLQKNHTVATKRTPLQVIAKVMKDKEILDITTITIVSLVTCMQQILTLQIRKYKTTKRHQHSRLWKRAGSIIWMTDRRRRWIHSELIMIFSLLQLKSFCPKWGMKTVKKLHDLSSFLKVCLSYSFHRIAFLLFFFVGCYSLDSFRSNAEVKSHEYVWMLNPRLD